MQLTEQNRFYVESDPIYTNIEIRMSSLSLHIFAFECPNSPNGLFGFNDPNIVWVCGLPLKMHLAEVVLPEHRTE